MGTEPNNKKKDMTYKPAGLNDTPKIVSAIFAVNDRDKEIDFKKNIKGKTKTIILGSTEREILSTDLTQGMVIPASDDREKSTNDAKDRDI